MTDAKIAGLIGLGSMGGGMARSLMRKGFTVHGADVNKAAVQALAADGLRAEKDPAAVAAAAAIVIVSVVNAAQTEAVLFGEGGVLETLPKGGVVVATSTVPPSFAGELGKRLAARNVLMIDAPVSGGAVGAQNGTLAIMGAGSEAAFERAQPALDAIAANVYRLSTVPGDGSKVKMINQLLAGVHIASACEAVAFAAKSGIDLRVLYEVISKSAGFSWMFGDRVPHILEGDYSSRSAIDIFVKDLGIVLDSARESSFPLPVTSVAHQLFLAAKALGLGKDDDASVVKVYRELSGITLP